MFFNTHFAVQRCDEKRKIKKIASLDKKNKRNKNILQTNNLKRYRF